MKKRKRTIRWIVGIILLAIVATGGYYGYRIYSFTQKIHVTPSALDATQSWTGGRVNILLLGQDARPGEKHTRSDSMILVSIDPVSHQAKVFSIMRDTWWKIPGYGYEKINAGNALGGPQKEVQTIENYLDIPIHYYVETNFTGFKKVVDLLGGVDLTVDENMDYYDPTDGTNIHLRKGPQHLDGKNALDFVRFRYDALGDFKRTERQREFLTVLASKAKSSVGLIKLPQLLDAMAPYMETNMTGSDMLQIGKLMYGVDLSTINTAQLPQTNDLLERNLPDGGAVLIPHVLAVRQFVHSSLGMEDTVTSTSAEEYYWNQYKTLPQKQPVDPSLEKSIPKDNPAPSASSGTQPPQTSGKGTTGSGATGDGGAATAPSGTPAGSGSGAGTTNGGGAPGTSGGQTGTGSGSGAGNPGSGSSSGTGSTNNGGSGSAGSGSGSGAPGSGSGNGGSGSGNGSSSGSGGGVSISPL